MVYRARMTEVDATDRIGSEQVEDPQALQRHALDLKRKADAATQAYERTAWIRYAAIWVPIPFGVLAFQAPLGSLAPLHRWRALHRCRRGNLRVDLAAVAKRDKAIQMAERAQEVYEKAARIVQRDGARGDDMIKLTSRRRTVSE